MAITGTHLSFEFFPPRTADAVLRLATTRERLAVYQPSFFSVTFGAGGSTRELTLETVLATRVATGIDSAPHISCMGTSKAEISEVLQHYQAAGVRRIVALRGDMPSGMSSMGELRYASELVSFIRAATGNAFHIEVAAYPEFHPQAKSPRDDLLNFKRKVDAGANSAITQYFYNADAYFRFIDDCEAIGIDLPVVPGIMPIGNFSQLARFSDACGAEIPRWLRLKLQSYGDDLPSIRSLGLDVITDLCRRLLEQGAPGLHFYTMNQAGLTGTIWKRLGL